MPIKVNIRQLEMREIPLEGELSAEELAMERPDELIHVREPLHYSLLAQESGLGILVQGTLSLTVDCECSRCLKPFKMEVEIPDWTAHIPLEGEEKAAIKDDSVDLTPYAREDILLEFPQHPLCGDDCAGLPKQAESPAKETKGGGQTSGSPLWAELNKLKF